MHIKKISSQACLNNRQPILAQLKSYCRQVPQVLEIGSGNGQHAVYFAEHLPHLVWQCSDRPQYHAQINAWLADAGLANLRAPLALDVTQPWPPVETHSVFSANTAHIMSWPAVECLFTGVAAHLAADGLFLLYGPFNRDGCFTSESNRRFDRSLKMQDATMGIRDDRELITLGAKNGLALYADEVMPANNRLLVWRRSASL